MTEEADVRRIPFVLALDAEPDEQQVPLDERRPWAGFEIALEWVGPVRDRLSAMTGRQANFGWFLRVDHQIEIAYGSRHWVADAHGGDLDDLTRKGDELGIHPHGWRLENDGSWIVDLGDEWVAQMVDESVETFTQIFGRGPLAHRFGDGHMSLRLVAQLRELGVRVDVTAEPGMTLTAAGVRAPRFRGKLPYSAGASRLGRAADPEVNALVLLPLASVDPDPALPALRRVARRLRYPNQSRHRQMVLGIDMPAKVFWNLLADDLDSGQLNVLAFAVRCSSFTSAVDKRLIEEKLNGLADHPLGPRIDFVTPSAAAELVLHS